MTWEEQRREPRRAVTGVARMAQRTSIIVGDDEQVYPCKILDASDGGYRISLRPMPKLEVGQEILFENTDKTRQRFYVCWVSAHEAGLKLVD